MLQIFVGTGIKGMPGVRLFYGETVDETSGRGKRLPLLSEPGFVG